MIERLDFYVDLNNSSVIYHDDGYVLPSDTMELVGLSASYTDATCRKHTILTTGQPVLGDSVNV